MFMRRAGDSGSAPDGPALTEGVQAQIDRYFFGSGGWTGPLGTAGAAVAMVGLTWPYSHHGRAIVWLVAALLVAVYMYVVNTVKKLRRPVDQRGIPWLATSAAAMTGVVFGAAPLIDPDLMRDEVGQVIVLAVLFGMSAGSVGGIAGIAGLGRFVIYPMWFMTSLSLIMLGQWWLAAATLLFLFVMARDLASTSDLLFEILFLRELSRDQADDAQRAARRDPLTGLLNRAGLEVATEAAVAVAGDSIITMFIDLDHFKSVNDRFGHAAGDKVLVEAGERLLTTVRPGDIVARLGGDEFLVILAEELSVAEREAVAKAIIDTLEVPFIVGNHEARISASVGVSVTPTSLFELSAVQREADHALYLAKGQGRRRSVRFDEGVRNELEARAGLETSLRAAIAAGDIEGWGQPIVDLETDQVFAVELLARWRRTDGTFCPPNTFIPLAEEIGLIGDLGDQMLQLGAATLERWRSHPELRNVSVSVNVSPRQLNDAEFVPRLERLVATSEIRPGQLILELTETAELHDLPNAHDLLDRVVASGVLLALDDFGSGYSSVQHLVGLPIEYVKIDGALVRDLGRDTRQTSLVRSIRDLAATLGRTVVVEGVESERQARLLSELRLHLVQGFLYARARPLEEITTTMVGFHARSSV